MDEWDFHGYCCRGYGCSNAKHRFRAVKALGIQSRTKLPILSPRGTSGERGNQ